jgi:two-component system cell cycle response regulator
MVSEADILNASILIVDDEPINVLLLEEVLRDAGYQRLTSTMASHEVCALHHANHYDLILLDLQMPGMDGFAVMEGLKEIDADGYAPILVITAQPDHKLRALACGAKDFVSKPFDLVEVKTRIRNMLEVRLLYKQLEHASREMASLALHDALTGLPNRRLLMDRLSLAIAHARRNKRPMAVMYLDLDGFKQVNDTWGHDAGDALLCLVAARLLASVRQEDTVARLGGDEFMIAVWDLGHADDIDKLAAKVIDSVSKAYEIQGHRVNMTASVGVGIYPADGETGDALMKRADQALFEAKRCGKNAYRLAGSLDAVAAKLR